MTNATAAEACDVLADLIRTPQRSAITHRLLAASVGSPEIHEFGGLLPFVDDRLPGAWRQTFSTPTWPGPPADLVARLLDDAAAELRRGAPGPAVAAAATRARPFAQALRLRAHHPFYRAVADLLLDWVARIEPVTEHGTLGV